MTIWQPVSWIIVPWLPMKSSNNWYIRAMISRCSLAKTSTKNGKQCRRKNNISFHGLLATGYKTIVLYSEYISRLTKDIEFLLSISTTVFCTGLPFFYLSCSIYLFFILWQYAVWCPRFLKFHWIISSLKTFWIFISERPRCRHFAL